MRTQKTVWFLCLAAIVACSDEAPTQPDEADSISISGTWSYQSGPITIDGITCTTTGRTMTINQDGTQFTGQLTGGAIDCTSEGSNFSQDLTGITDAIVNGIIEGTSVSFDLDVLPGTSVTGTVSGNSMSGTVVEQVYTETGTASGSGAWSAAR